MDASLQIVANVSGQRADSDLHEFSLIGWKVSTDLSLEKEKRIGEKGRRKVGPALGRNVGKRL